jgi:Ca-activated chloride channel homolog
VKDGGVGFAKASPDFRFAASVAGFGMVLRDSPHKGACTLGAVREWAQEGKGEDLGNYRGEFIELIRKAQAVAPH